MLTISGTLQPSHQYGGKSVGACCIYSDHDHQHVASTTVGTGSHAISKLGTKEANRSINPEKASAAAAPPWESHPRSRDHGTFRSALIHRDSAALVICPPHVRLEGSQLPLPRENTALEHVGALLALYFMFCVPWVLLAAMLWALIAAWSGNLIAIGYLSILFVDLLAPHGQLWEAFRHASVWDALRRHFRLQVVTAPMPVIPQDRTVIVAQFPHGVFPMAYWLSAVIIGHRATGGNFTQGVVASSLLQLPILKHVVGWMGGKVADRQMMMRLLQEGCCVGTVPEGLAGVFNGSTASEERVCLSRHKGYIRVALDAGVDILPVYHMGNSQLLSYWGNAHLSRKLRVAIGFFYGAWGLPLPRRHRLITLVGPLIPVKRSARPIEEDVELVHNQVCAAVQALYEKHKHLMPGWAERPIVLE